MKIIDGYNLIGAAGDFGITLAQPDKEDRLLRLLGAYRSRRRAREPMLVIFDGHHGRLAAGPRRFSQAGIGVEYAIGESADAIIVRRVREASRPRDVEVVTSDVQVQRGAATSGAKSTRSQTFIERVRETLRETPGEEKPVASSPSEIAEWLARFSDP